MRTIKKHNGVAGILFIGLLPIMVIFMAFSMQMAQQMLAHARVLEAAEVSSLALIASPKETEDDNVKYARQLVDRYVVDNINDVDVEVYTRKCEYKDGCVQASGELAPFSDFVVSAKAEHKSWIAYEEADLKPEFEVAGQSVTRKYLPQPVDVYFIADFSGSMKHHWKGGKSKLDVVKQTIERVVEDIENFNTEEKSRIALMGYNPMHVKQTGTVYLNAYGYRRSWPRKVAYNFARNTASQTVAKMFDKPIVYSKVQEYVSGMSRLEVKSLVQNNDRFVDYYKFYDIPLTEDYANFKRRLSNASLGAEGGTSSWNGIIAAAQEANRATNINPEQVFIVLSDGADNDEGYLQRLVNQGLCKELRSTISARRNRFQSKTGSAGKTKVTMGVIGVDYRVKESDGFGDCFGRKNIYHAKDGDDVYKYILNLINEETGRLKD
ncbi:VWA domain-containing protein [Vibrio europaeus]|uniref:TadE/TadG family type IV pilus assembly protein n=1 Tax=Vibrio europaeus TaxID=300876 RepID=UPI002341F290|nr:vWA domain-containing protein [Vibrio europaeus]MDC5842350.1 VWA domain-containing protein [Vibrio europaeus]